ncbi:uncharacterized protein [Apostichopus japonicus]|uniref:uncharacterized protein n=1 Tax=Stichopus japonicus TaxID=307972 RepID=UPI003AB80DBE
MESLKCITMVLTVTSLLVAVCGAIKMNHSSNVEYIEEGKQTTLQCSHQIRSDISCNKSVFHWIFVNRAGQDSSIANATSVKSPQFAGNYFASFYERLLLKTDLKECIFTLELFNASSNLDGQYRCHWNSKMTIEVPIQVVPIQESVEPKCSFQVTNHTNALQDIELTCSAAPVNPFVKLLWFEDGDMMTSLNSTAQIGSLTSKVELMPRNGSQTEITYVCQAFNTSDHKLLGQCSITCHVNITIYATMENNSCRPTGTFRCPFEMSIEGIQYKRHWLLDGKSINDQDQTDRFIIEGHSGVLHMTDVLPNDNGKNLSCMITTMLGTYTAETMIAWDTENPTKAPNKGPSPNNSISMLFLIAIGIFFIICINVLVCVMIVKSRGQRRRAMGQESGVETGQQEGGLYASGIVTTDTNGTMVATGYAPMKDVCPGHYDPEEPYQAMEDGEGKRESEYQVPSVNVDCEPIKRMQSAKYMNTLGGKVKRFNVFSFSKRKEHRNGKATTLEVCTALDGGAEGTYLPPISPNCYAKPEYSADSKPQVSSSNVAENDYDELNTKDK